ncbi:MAG: hypothetical protein K9M54_12535 [Kiritimatiellales bacterium]|nr:hypothetical protein [Kiritimatiellales bacterium]
MKRTVETALIFAALTCATVAHAKSLVWWDAKGISAASVPVLANEWGDRLVQSNLCTLSLSPAAALNAKTNSGTYGWSNQFETTINLGKYISWNLVPQDGDSLSVASIHISLWRNGSGATNLALRSSLDGFQTNLDAWSITSNGAVDHDAVFPAGLALSTNVEFRLYMWGGTAGGASTYLRTSNAKSVHIKGVKIGYSAYSDVVDYGAVPDDGLDDAPVFQEVLDLLAAGGGGTMHIPPGYFVFSNKVSVAAGNVDIGIIGEGNGSRIYCENSNGVFRFDFSDNQAQLGLSNFTCIATAPTNGTALEVNAPIGGSGTGRTLSMHKMEFVGDDITQDSFHRAVVGDGLWRPRLSIVTVGGPYGPNASYTNVYLTEVCYRFSNVDQPVFESCSAWCAQTGYDVGLRSAATEPLFNHCQAVSVVHSMNVRSAGTNLVPGVRIIDSHPNGARTGIVCERLSDFAIGGGMVFYHGAEPEMVTTNYLDLVLSNCVDGVISGNTFHYGNLRTQIVVADDCSGIQITDNFFNVPSSGSPVRLAAASSVGKMSGNLFNYVHADEQDMVALWHMDSAVSGPTNYVADDDALNPSRNNRLNLYGCYVDPASGDTNKSFDGSLVFAQTNDYAQSQENWPGTPGIRLDTYVWFDTANGQQYAVSAANAFRVQSMASSIKFLWKDQTNAWQTLSVNNAITPGAWHHITAEVNPSIGLAILEVEGVGRDSMEIGTSYMNGSVAPIKLGQGGNAEFLGKIDETVVSALSSVGEQTLTVATPHGQASPAVGKTWFVYGSSNSASVVGSPVANGTTTQYTCVGWTGTGNVPASGTSTNTGSFSLTTDSAITWLWNTNYWLDTFAAAGGSVDVPDGWQTNGAGVQLTATPDAYYHFAGWSGDTAGDTNNAQMTLPMTGARSVAASFAPNLTAETGTPEWWLAQYGLTNFGPDSLADADGDGLSSWQEYVAGTNPTNPLSVFEITSESVGAQGAIIRWSSVSNRFYSLFRSTNLSGIFAIVPGAGDLPATPPENIYTNPADNGASAFYRVSVHE